MFNKDINILFNYIINKADFIMRTTRNIESHNQFMDSEEGVILFNSTTMCLQIIGEYIKQIDNMTSGKLFNKFNDYPWSDVIGMRHFISHEYMSVDPSIVFRTIKTQLHPLKDNLNKVKDYYNFYNQLISDIKLVKNNIDGLNRYYISCSIDGVRQLRKEIKDNIINEFLLKNQIRFSKIPDSFKLVLCSDLYSNEIKLNQNLSKGWKF